MDESDGRRDCYHQRVHHRHGTRAAYVADRCRCSPCKEANRTAARARRRAVTYGTWRPYQPGGPTARHLSRLVAAGMTISDIAAAASIARSTVSRLLRADELGRIRTATHLAVLSVETPHRPRAHRRSAATPRAAATDAGQQ